MKRIRNIFVSGIITNLLLVSPVFADDSKNQYHLFNPTPKEKMRGLNTDRPDKTESAYTVDAGHFQFETDLVTFSHDKNKDETSDSITFNFITQSLYLIGYMN